MMLGIQCNYVQSQISTPQTLTPTTLPQMQVTALVLGKKLAQHTKNLLNIDEVYVWTDSEIFLHWIGKNKCKILQPHSHQEESC